MNTKLDEVLEAIIDWLLDQALTPDIKVRASLLYRVARMQHSVIR